MPMKSARLGASGPEVSELCLGTMNWGSQVTDEAAVHAMLDAFVAAGGTFIDTAEAYPIPPGPEWLGRTEEYLGRWLTARPGLREKLVLASKVCGPSGRPFVNNNRPDLAKYNLDPESIPNLDRGNIRSACAGILKRLQVDYLDILYLHWPSRPVPLFGSTVYTAAMKDQHPLIRQGTPYHIVPLEESIRAMAELITEGKVRHWAISNETSFGVCTIAEICQRLGAPKPVCIQNDFSLLDRRFQYEVAEACAPWHHNVSGCPYGVLAGGTLSGKYNGPSEPPPEARHVWDPKFQPRYHSPRALAATAKYAALAKAKGLSPTVLALAWARQCFFNQAIIIGASNLEQLRECLSVVDVELDEETLQAIDDIHAEDKNPTCRL